MRFAVAGGTGAIGRQVVERARARGHDVAIVARSAGSDVRTGEGLDDALKGADALIDVVSVQTLRAATATSFYERAAGNLLASAARMSVPHVVVLSIVGVDRDPHGYYAGKVAQEAAYENGRVPWSLVRATQFHEFAEQIARRARLGPVQLAPRARVQPIAAAEVAEQLLTIAEGDPSGRTPDIAGPQEEELSDMIRRWSEAQGRRGPVIPVSLPDAQMRGMRQGLVLPGPDAIRRGPTFAEWLEAQPRG